MRKNGFTLIEVIAAMAILTTTILFGSVSKKYYEEYRNKVEDRLVVEEILNGLNKARRIVIEKNASGVLSYKRITNTVEINIRKIGKIKIKLSENYSFLLNRNLEIKSDGKITSGSMKLTNKESGKEYRITMDVVLNTLRVYEE